MTTNFFSPLSFVAVYGSGIRDPGDPGWEKIRINTALKYDFHGNANEIFFRKAYQHNAAIKK
jgi:hypothetical protein